MPTITGTVMITGTTMGTTSNRHGCRDEILMTCDYLKDPGEITALSFEIIRREVNFDKVPEDLVALATRLVHACALPDIIDDLAWSDGAGAAGTKALEKGAPIFCDAEMVAHGIIRERLTSANEVICTLNAPQTRALAKSLGTTRSAAALEAWKPRLNGAVIAIGNAPTALFHLLEMIAQEGFRPALILGFPVGFVGAAESKDALIEAAKNAAIPFVTLKGRRGGSAMASAAVNALSSDGARKNP